MEDVRKTLELLYPGEQTETIVSSIEELIKKNNSWKSTQKKLSEEDILLITYADQVFHSSGSKTTTLHQFLKRHLSEVTMVHLLPFYPYSSDDGFSVIDYYEVRKDLGTWDDIESFSQDFKLMFDAVINHMSAESEWFNNFLNEETDYKEYFIDGSSYQNLDDVVRPRTSPLTHDFNGKQVWTTFSRDQVDLNYESPKLLLQILDVLLFYVSKGARLIRLDAIGFLWKKNGTTCIHLEETHQIIKLMRAVIERVDRNVLLVSETNVPHEENISYFGDGDEAHMVYNFTLPPLLAYSILTGTSEKLMKWARTLEVDKPNTCFFNFLASHDGVGVRPVSGILNENEVNVLVESAEANGGRISYRSVGDKQSPYEINCNYFSLLSGIEKTDELAVKRMILAHAILLSFPGLPAIYFHSIFGMKNDVDGMNRLGYNRAINRQKFDLAEIENLLKEDSRVLDGIKQLIRVRKKYDAFNPYAEYEFTEVDKKILTIRRIGSTGTVECFFNLSKEEVLVHPEGERELITGSEVDGPISLDPYEFGWYL